MLKLKPKSFHVIMDPRDNSVVLPTDLFHHLGGIDGCHRVYVFKIAGTESDYAFIANPDFAEETQVAEVQYNTKTKNVGFETLIPTVVTMFARWNFDLQKPRKVAICEQSTIFDFGSFYEFDPAHSEEV